MSKIKKARMKAGLTRAEMARRFEIPIRTLEDWEAEKRVPSIWAEKLILEKLERMSMTKEQFMEKLIETDGNDYSFAERKWFAYSIGYAAALLKRIETKGSMPHRRMQEFLHTQQKFSHLKSRVMQYYKRSNQYIKVRGSENMDEKSLYLNCLLPFIFGCEIPGPDKLNVDEEAMCIAGTIDGEGKMLK